MAVKHNEETNLELCKTLFQNNLDSILLTKIDGTTFYANPAAESLFGYNQDEICNLGRKGIVDPIDKNLHTLLEDRIKYGQAKGELNLIKKDGTKFPAEISMSIFSHDGNNNSTFMIIRDISKRKQNQQQIAYHSLLLGQVNDAVVGVDENFRINYWNKGAEDIYGFTEAEAIGKKTNKLLQHANFLNKNMESNSKTNFTMDTSNKNGEKIVVEVNSRKINDKSGNRGYLIVYHDITRIKEEEQIKKRLREHEHILTDQLQTTNLDLKIMTEKLTETNKELMLQQDYLLNLNQELEEREELSKALNRVNASINSNYGYDEIMESILEEGVKSIGAESSLINLLENDKWVVKYTFNFPDNIKGQVKSHEESPTSIYVANEKKAVAFNDAVNDPRVNRNGMKIHGVASLLAAPILLNNEVIGVIAFYHHKDHVAFSEAKLDFANKLASLLSHAIENSKLFGAIKKSEEKYRNIINNLQDGFIRSDINNEIVMVSPSAVRMHEFSSSSIMEGVGVGTLFQDSKKLDQIVDILNERGEVKNFEVTLLKMNGMSFYASLNCQYQLGEQGQKLGIDIFIRDITEQKQIEADLEKNRNNLSEAQRIAHIGSWEWMVDTDELSWSDELYSIFNLDKKSYNPTMKSFFNYIHPDDSDFVSKQINNLVLGKEKVKFDFKIILKDGTTRILTAFAEVRDQDPNGKPKKIIGIYQDVTEIKVAEQEILEGKNVIDAINQVFKESLTAKSEREVVNKCLDVAEDLTGSDFGFLGEINKNQRLDGLALSLSGWDKCHTENADKLLKNMEIVSYWGRTIKTHESQIVNDPDTDPDKIGLPEGHPPIINFMGVPLKNGEKIIGMIGLANKKNGYSDTDKRNIETLSLAFVEVLMRKKAELEIIENMKRLEQSNKELEQFAYITSHDLREPLRMITSFLQLLQRRYENQLDKEANEFIGFAVDGAKRLDNMTNDLLSYSRITSKKRVVGLVNFEQVLKETLENLKIPIEETSAVITHDPLPTVKGDTKLKIQLFQNLIGNAIKYRSQKPPEIHISAKRKNDHYVFSIRDNGIGMSQEHLKKIFTIFQRLHTHQEYEGTGIGLAIAQKIVQQQGGTIWVESELGKGTTFYFTIPITPKYD